MCLLVFSRTRVDAFMSRLAARFDLPNSTGINALLVRTTADEASASMAFLQASAWVLKKMSFFVGAAPWAFRSWWDRNFGTFFAKSGLVLLSLLYFVAAAFLLPVALVVAIVIWLGFGIEAGLCGYMADISVETTPPGEWIIHQFSADTEATYLLGSNQRANGAIRVIENHGCYLDTRVVDLVASWIRSRVVDESTVVSGL